MRALLTFLPLLAALAFPATAHEPAHHAVSVAATTNPMQRWKTDAPLREGMGRARAAGDALQHYEHGHIRPQQAVQLAEGIERDIAFIVAHCTLEPRADAALHPILGALMVSAQTLEADPTDRNAIPSMRSALHDYARQFEDPGMRSGEPEETR